MDIRVSFEDLELYYLQTRYYDPTVCRFISPDHSDYLDYESINGSTHAQNAFRQLLNMPIAVIDDGYIT